MEKVQMSKELAEQLIGSYLFELESIAADMTDDAFDDLKDFLKEIKIIVNENNLDVDLDFIEMYDYESDDDIEEEDDFIDCLNSDKCALSNENNKIVLPEHFKNTMVEPLDKVIVHVIDDSFSNDAFIYSVRNFIGIGEEYIVFADEDGKFYKSLSSFIDEYDTCIATCFEIVKNIE